MKAVALAAFLLCSLSSVAQTNRGVGSIVVDCDGKTYLQWTNVGCFVVIQRTQDMQSWSNVIVHAWLDCPTNARSVRVPLARTEEREFFRLIAYQRIDFSL